MSLRPPHAPIGIGRQLRSAWRLAGPYFRSQKETGIDFGRLGIWRIKEKWIACSLLSAVLVIELGQLGLTVLTNQWYARFFNAIQEKDITAFWRELAVYSAIAAVFVCISAYQLYVNRWLHIRWRTWLGERCSCPSRSWALGGGYVRTRHSPRAVTIENPNSLYGVRRGEGRCIDKRLEVAIEA